MLNASTLTWICLTVIGLAILKMILKQVKCWILFRNMPGPEEPAYPVLGHSLLFLGGPVKLYKELHRVMSGIRDRGHQLGRIWLSTLPIIVITGPEAAETILRSSRHNEKSAFYDLFHPWLKRGLLTSHGEKWKSRRRLLTPTFHFEILHDFLEVMNEQSNAFLRKIEPHAAHKDTFDIAWPIALCTLDTICHTAMGVSVHALDEKDDGYVHALGRTTTLLQRRMWSPWLWSETIYSLINDGKEAQQHLDTLHQFTRKVITERVDELHHHEGLLKKKRQAFLDMLVSMYEKEKLSLDDIQEEVDTFMFEGHDTTSAALSWAFLMIGNHKDVEMKLQDEIDALFENKAQRYQLTMDDLKKLTYLELVIKESLRILPAVPIIGRKTSENCVIDGHLLPAGTEIFLFTQVIHHDPKYWENPLEFKPERFATEEFEGRHPFSYLPFSAGPRNCIGQRFAMMELKVVLASFLRKFEIEWCQPAEDVQVMGDAILRPYDGIQMRIALRG